jgi:phosphoribosyl-ATP pyrophosphohydrolase/phosphoribosyl-AMP cyclohydrolase/histidinol dehydrogenase
VPPCDAVVGPGNRWVTAAKHLVSGKVAIDGLAGPSELLVLADQSADAVTIAADLLAQAEHDPDATPILLTTSSALADAVDAELQAQLATLPTADIARAALRNGFACVVRDLDEGCALCERLAPEHVALHVEEPLVLAPRLRCHGTLFLGAASAEVLGDYGAGPNHVLPTGGSARFATGLSVLTFLRARTWLRIDDVRAARALAADAAALARLEGLEGHARAAHRRAKP